MSIQTVYVREAPEGAPTPTNGQARPGVQSEKRRPAAEREDSPLFLAQYMVACAGVLAVVFAINFAGNAEDLFPSPWRPATSDRAWKTRRLEECVRAGSAPKALILGSSRLMQMRPAYIEAITGKKTYNYAVTGANLLDCLVQYRYALRLGTKPDLIIMNVDERMLLGDVSKANVRLAGHPGLLREVPAWDRARIVYRLIRSIDVASTISSIRALLHAPRPEGEVLSLDTVVFTGDGYRINRRRALAKEKRVYDLRAEMQNDAIDAELRSGEGSDSGTCAFNPRMIEYFRQLLQSVKAEGIEVYVIITPEHPTLSDTKMGEARRKLLGELKKLVSEECRSLALNYRDFSDLASFGGAPDEFWDSCHQTPANMQRMTNVLFGINPMHSMARLPSEVDLLRGLGLDQER
jgi:hypothetical protein